MAAQFEETDIPASASKGREARYNPFEEFVPTVVGSGKAYKFPLAELADDAEKDTLNNLVPGSDDHTEYLVKLWGRARRMLVAAGDKITELPGENGEVEEVDGVQVRTTPFDKTNPVNYVNFWIQAKPKTKRPRTTK